MGGGRGKFWEVAVGVHLPALLIFTLFQSNIYKVNVREYRPGIYVVKMNTITTLWWLDMKFLPMLSEGSR